MNKKPRLYDLVTNVLITGICIAGLLGVWEQYSQAKHINNLFNLIEQQNIISATRQGYLNQRIDLVDLSARNANNTAQSAWSQADKSRVRRYEWMIGKTTDEIDAIALRMK